MTAKCSNQPLKNLNLIFLFKCRLVHKSLIIFTRIIRIIKYILKFKLSLYNYCMLYYTVMYKNKITATMNFLLMHSFNYCIKLVLNYIVLNYVLYNMVHKKK